VAGEPLSREELAERSGVDTAFIARLIDTGLLQATGDGLFDPLDVRRVGIVHTMLEAGLALETLAEGIRRGVVSLDFLRGEEYARFGGLTSETFQAASARTGVPVELLTSIREALGSGMARPQDRIREHEQPIVAFVSAQHRAGFRAAAIERLLRTLGDSFHRIAEAEAEWWRSEVIDPNIKAGRSPESLASSELALELTGRGEAAMLAILHAQEVQTWSANIIGGFSQLLAEAGIHQPQKRDPAICFLDITGYTRLTQERGDLAAANVAESLGLVVKRASVERGGRPVKWLGDGVMLLFPNPGPGVVAALDMMDGLVQAGLPPAHVGLHTGPIVIQEGDYYGQTVNMASRIAEYARPSEVLVSRAVVEASNEPGISFSDIGEVELKGVAGVVELHVARRSPETG
jgi:adenylate cyclase